MDYFALEPEAAGEFGENTELDTSVHPPKVLQLDVVLDEWLGDDLLWVYPAYLVSQQLADKLVASGLREFALRNVAVSILPEAEEWLDGRIVPTFLWWQVTGQAGVDDFGVTDKGHLVVSERGLAILKANGQLEECDVTVFEQ